MSNCHRESYQFSTQINKFDWEPQTHAETNPVSINMDQIIPTDSTQNVKLFKTQYCFNMPVMLSSVGELV